MPCRSRAIRHRGGKSYGDLNSAVTRAKTERMQREAVPAGHQAADDPRALDSLPAVVSNTFMQQQRAELSALQREQAQLGEKLGDRHPEMARVRQAVAAAQTRLRSAIQEVVTALRNDYEAAGGSGGRVDNRVEPAEGRGPVVEPQGRSSDRSAA